MNSNRSRKSIRMHASCQTGNYTVIKIIGRLHMIIECRIFFLDFFICQTEKIFFESRSNIACTMCMSMQHKISEPNKTVYTQHKIKFHGHNQLTLCMMSFYSKRVKSCHFTLHIKNNTFETHLRLVRVLSRILHYR